MQEVPNEIEEIIKEDIWGNLKEFLNLGFHLGQGSTSVNLSIGLLLLLTLAFVATRFLLKWLRRLLTRKMQNEDKQKFSSVFKFTNYVIYLIVIMGTLSAAGIDITLILTASAALFVGLGLALQELFKDVLGGIFIIIDKSLQVGDIIEIDGKVGKIFEIKLRTTRAITRDDKVVIIPNHNFISDIVYNYTQNHKTTREKISIGVAYGSDVRLVTKILEEVAAAQKQVLNYPKSFVLFDDFGDSALLFSLHFYSNDIFADPKTKSEMRYTINEKFLKNNIAIPFPQRDIHIISPPQNQEEA